ncbi:MAG: LPP20 family lipoprotein [Helicobacteraceae bacterium]|nr:LPP20 family lipoprotein [Helicobacteraceae bacterium]
MKRLMGIALAIAAAIALVGCGGKQPETSAEGKCEIDGEEAPKWVCIPYYDDKTIAGLGTAQRNKANDYGFQRNQAESAGRNAIALSVATNVRAAFDSWQRNTGIGEDAVFEQNVESVSRQTSFLSVKGTKVSDTWQHPSNGTLFVLITAPLDQAENAMLTSLRNENALWQQFQSQKAQEQLKEEFEKAVQR